MPGKRTTLIYTLLVLLFITSPVLAHTGENENPSDIEVLVSGVGFLIVLLSMFSLIWKQTTPENIARIKREKKQAEQQAQETKASE